MFDSAVAISRIRAGECACEKCAGRLTDPALSKGGWGFCRDCKCAWQVAAPDGHEYAATVPSDLHRPPPSPPRVAATTDDRHG